MGEGKGRIGLKVEGRETGKMNERGRISVEVEGNEETRRGCEKEGYEGKCGRIRGMIGIGRRQNEVGKDTKGRTSSQNEQKREKLVQT